MNDNKKMTVTISAVVAITISIICTTFHTSVIIPWVHIKKTQTVTF